jgi:SP family general alpha glucoside:H+ symporter-like MFS transporter
VLTPSAPNIQTLFVGELLCGLPWGAFSSVSVSDRRVDREVVVLKEWTGRELTTQSAVSYASEVCPTALRGYLTTYVNLCWVIGQFIAAGVLLGVQDRTDQWAYKIPFAIQWIWPVPLFILATFAPGK